MTQTRQQIIETLEALSREHPTMRFGQLISTIAFLVKGPKPSAVSEVDDEAFLKAALDHLDHRANQQPASQ